MALNYVTLSDLKDVMPEDDQAEATDDSAGPNTDPTRDDAMTERYLEMAESRVESYLTGYTLSTIRDSPPQMIRWAVLVMATWMLLNRADLSTSDNVDRMYQSVISWLQDIQSGEAQIPEIDEDDADFVGFGDKDDMDFDSFPERRFAFLE